MLKSSAYAAREEFEVFRHRTYLNWASLSPPPSRAVRAVSSMAAQASSFSQGDLDATWSELSSGLRKQAALLLNSTPDEIAVSGSSTTQGIQLALGAVNPKKGDNIVTTGLEFPGTQAELQRWKERGVEVRTAVSRNGTYDAEDVTRLMNSRTRAVVLSSVVWVNGFKPDTAAISKAAHESGAYVIVDAVQHMGAMKFDVRELSPDFAAAGGQKWLTSPFGTAILYVSRKASEELPPPFYSVNNSVEPEKGWMAFFTGEVEMSSVQYRPVADARRMEYGGWQNHTGMAALKESIGLLNQTGTENVQARIGMLSKHLAEELSDLKARIISPSDEMHAPSITTFGVSKDRGEHLRLVEKLRKDSIDVSCRHASGIGGIRVSVHHMNNEEDIGRFAEGLRSALGR